MRIDTTMWIVQSGPAVCGVYPDTGRSVSESRGHGILCVPLTERQRFQSSKLARQVRLPQGTP